MATHEIRPQRLAEWLAAGNEMPPFLAGHIQDYLASVGIVADVTVSRDGDVTFETDATDDDLINALEDMTPADINPDGDRQGQAEGIMAQLDAYADAVEAGQTPSAAQTQAAVARLVRVVQYVAARR
jgi:hypothetical protein